MKLRKSLGAAVLAAALAGTVGAGVSSTSAQTLHQGNPYGCTINPNAAGCTSSNTPPPSVLPSTGGAQPVSPSTPLDPAGAALGGAGLIIAGFALRRVTRRRS